jgi:hypothetical protein
LREGQPAGHADVKKLVRSVVSCAFLVRLRGITTPKQWSVSSAAKAYKVVEFDESLHLVIFKTWKDYMAHSESVDESAQRGSELLKCLETQTM